MERHGTNQEEHDHVQALACVRFCEELIWVVTPVSSPAPGMPTPFRTGAMSSTSGAGVSQVALPWVACPPPTRQRTDPGVLAHLSPRQRRVWLLINGRRTVHELASLLGVTLETLDRELTALERQGFLTPGSIQQRR